MLPYSPCFKRLSFFGFASMPATDSDKQLGLRRKGAQVVQQENTTSIDAVQKR